MTLLALKPTTLDVLDLASGGSRLSGIDEVAQRVRISLAIGKGEWWRDGSRGLDLRGVWLVNSPSPLGMEADFRRVVLAVPGVTGVRDVAVTIDRARRTVSVRAVVLTAEGSIAVSSDGDPATLGDLLRWRMVDTHGPSIAPAP